MALNVPRPGSGSDYVDPAPQGEAGHAHPQTLAVHQGPGVRGEEAQHLVPPGSGAQSRGPAWELINIEHSNQNSNLLRMP